MNDIEEKAHIFGSVFILANRLQVLGDRFDRNLTVKQWLLLIGILKSKESSPTISEVAGFIGNSRQNVKKMALILQKKGFLILDKDLSDARILRMSVTDKCEIYFTQRESREIEFFEKLYSGFDTNLIKGLNNGISKLGENIVEMEKQYVK
ncbi:MAG: MarR family winged helix-turn-helix transcriptional regulator [Ruminiclostridium sp.]